MLLPPSGTQCVVATPDETLKNAMAFPLTSMPATAGKMLRYAALRPAAAAGVRLLVVL
jgi:hypothetical protein